LDEERLDESAPVVRVRQGLDATRQARPQPSAQLVDSFGRVHRDLRVSVTDRCPLRCAYCVPLDDPRPLPRRDLMTAGEIVKAVRVAVELGVTRVRLTGGEPLQRPDLPDIVAGIAALPSPPQIALTTCGIGLDRLARRLARAGLGRVNVSLDTVDRDRFKLITGRDRLADALAGIDAACAAGLRPVKLNAVLLPGGNEDDALSLVEFALARGCELRFIEYMPLGGRRPWRRDQLVTADAVLDRLRARYRLTPLPGRGHSPAARWLVDGGPGVVGVIAAVTHPFCGDCDRLRLTADGQLRSCLFGNVEHDLLGPLRRGADDAELADVLRGSVWAKPPGHGIDQPGFHPPSRPMSAIGG
jgi:cyclic pyranopterin phosphate synthase